MRSLRVVGITEDGSVVLEDSARRERFTVPADDRLRAAARGDLSRLGQIAIELESQLRPREIQARIRAGASVEQVATAAGVPEQKIERFAYPVLLERLRTADNAQRAHPMRVDGPDNRTLAEVVAHTFGLRGQPYDGAKWDSWKGEDGRWVVALSWRAGRSDNRAHWVFQPGAHGGTVTALDERASDLVEGLPARPLRTVGAVVDMARPEEEPPPTSSPVEQWRAAASDSYREQRLPTPPDPGRRAPSEPWRPAPPQRQVEPPAAYRPAEAPAGRPEASRRPEPPADPRPSAGQRPTDALADPRPAGRTDAYRPAEPPTGYRSPAPQHVTAAPAERNGGASQATTEWAPWERGVTRTAAPPAAADVAVPAARTATPVESAPDATLPPSPAPAPPAVQAEPVVEPPTPQSPAVPATTRTTDQDTPDPAEPSVAEPAAAPSGTEPSADEPSATTPAADPSADEPAATEPSAHTPPAAEPPAAEPPAA